jgi:hypothetical protein
VLCFPICTDVKYLIVALTPLGVCVLVLLFFFLPMYIKASNRSYSLSLPPCAASLHSVSAR